MMMHIDRGPHLPNSGRLKRNPISGTRRGSWTKMSPFNGLLAIALFLVFLGFQAVQGRSVSYGHGRSLLQVTSSLIGYQQGVYLGIEGPDPSGECSVSGIPGPDGYSPPGPSPVLFTTPKGTGVHIISTSLPSGYYTDVVLLSDPPSGSYRIDRTDPYNPTLVFNASQANVGESGIAAIAVYDGSSTYICKSTISFEVTATLGCLPTSTGPIIPQPTGNTVYLDNSVSSTIIQQITVVNSVSIVNIQNVQSINQATCICCYNSCNNNYVYEYYNITVNNNTSTPSPPPPYYIPIGAPPPRAVPPTVPPASGPPPGTVPPRPSPTTPPPRTGPPPAAGGSPPPTITTPPPRLSPPSGFSPPPPATLQAPPPGGNRTTFTLTPPAGK